MMNPWRSDAGGYGVLGLSGGSPSEPAIGTPLCGVIHKMYYDAP